MQAILISAYKNITYLQRLINFFDGKYKVFVHIDKKSKINPKSLRINNNVRIYKKFIINWGSYSHLEAIVFLLQKALKNKNIKFIHIISGQDMPVKKLSDFEIFEDSNLIYMEDFKLSNINSKFAERFQNGTLIPKADQRKKIIIGINKIYSCLHKKKKSLGEFDYDHIYKGLIWLSLPRNAGEYVLGYIFKKNFMKSLYHVAIPEEFFFQTILENSPFKSKIQKSNLIYSDWSRKRNGSLPAILDSSDYKKIINSDFFFARKIDPKISKELIYRISKNINNF